MAEQSGITKVATDAKISLTKDNRSLEDVFNSLDSDGKFEIFEIVLPFDLCGVIVLLCIAFSGKQPLW